MTILPAGGKKYNNAKSKFVGRAQWNQAGSALLVSLLHPFGPKCRFCTLLGSELFVEGRKETRWKNKKSKAHF